MVKKSPNFIRILVVFLCLCLFACHNKQKETSKGQITLVFKHGKIAGGPQALNSLLRRFEALNPGIKVKDETLPASTDEQHQFYVINLEAKSEDFDVLSMDVIWVQEFARAGWLRDLSDLLPEAERNAFFSGPMQAITYKGRVFAIPWYINAGVLYYRKDLLAKYGFSPPKTWPELVRTTQTIMQKENIYGFIWQGKQYEGLVCNVLEYLWGNGGGIFKEGRLAVYTKENLVALSFVRDLIFKYKVSPTLVTTATEETTRHIFGKGKALFMRNWPYAWNIFQRKGSLIKGKVGVCSLPTFPGHKSASTLGGWQLGINKYSKHPEAAKRLVKFLTSPEAEKVLVLSVGYKPPRKALYKDKELRERQPFIVGLYDVFMQARPRPVTSYYMMMTQILQPEFSSAITGIKTPEAALKSIEAQLAHLLKLESHER